MALSVLSCVCVRSLASAPPKGASQLGRPVLSVHSSLWPKGAPNAELNDSVLLKDPPSAHTGWECLMVVCVCGRPCAGVEERSLTSSWAVPLQMEWEVILWCLSEQWAVTCLPPFSIRNGHFGHLFSAFCATIEYKNSVFCSVQLQTLKYF